MSLLGVKENQYKQRKHFLNFFIMTKMFQIIKVVPEIIVAEISNVM